MTSALLLSLLYKKIKRNMNLTTAELNELIYCVGHTLNENDTLVDREIARKLLTRLNDELEYRLSNDQG